MRPVNFRDVGESLGLWLDPSPLPIGRLLRGGRFDTLSSLQDLGNPLTILNLRRGPEPDHLDAARAHVPAPDDVENYQTHQRRVLEWVRSAIATLASGESPVYVHCTSGRDRTGVVVAAVLLEIGVPPDVIVDEYLLSEGGDPALIARAITGLSARSLLGARDRVALRRRLGVLD